MPRTIIELGSNAGRPPPRARNTPCDYDQDCQGILVMEPGVDRHSFAHAAGTRASLPFAILRMRPIYEGTMYTKAGESEQWYKPLRQAVNTTQQSRWGQDTDGAGGLKLLALSVDIKMKRRGSKRLGYGVQFAQGKWSNHTTIDYNYGDHWRPAREVSWCCCLRTHSMPPTGCNVS